MSRKAKVEPGKRKRARKGMGRLFKQAAGGKCYPPDAPIGGTYFLQYTVAGEKRAEILRTPEGEPITDRAQAEAARMRIVGPMLAGSKADALRAVRDRLAQADDDRAAAIEAKGKSLSLADGWRAYERTPAGSERGKVGTRPDSSERTLAGYESAFKRFKAWMEKEHPGALLLRDVDPETAAAYAAHLTGQGLTPSTFNQHIGLLRLMWRVLEKEIGGAEGNPWLQVSKRRANRITHRRRAPTPDQFEAVLKAAPDADMHDLLFTLAWTGQRLVDVVTLRWDAISFKRKVVTLYPRKTRRTGKAVHVPLLPPLADLLGKRREAAGGKLVFPELASEYERDTSYLPKQIGKVFEAADLTPRETLPGVKRAVTRYGAHSLRHYFATAAVSAGLPAEIVKRITGHASDDMLAGYEHVDARMIGELAAKIGNGVAALPGRDPLPDWAIELVETLTPENAAEIRAALLEGGRA